MKSNITGKPDWNPVEGWVKIEEIREHFDLVGCGTIYKTSGEDRVPLYTTPPQREWVGLTLEDMQDLNVSKDWIDGARWAATLLWEKNNAKT